MEEKELEAIEINALALRKLADKVLEQVRAAKHAAPARSRKEKKVYSVANLKSRILSGSLKPDSIRKTKK